MKQLHILWLVIFLFSFETGFGQNYEVYNFQEFENYLYKQDNKTYVINFWATWCKPCVEEMPAFNQLHEEYKNKNVEIILVSLDFGKNVDARIRSFATKHNIQSKIIILDDPDSNSWIDKVSTSWSGAIPATLIYNKTQRIFHEGSFTYEMLEKEVQNFL